MVFAFAIKTSSPYSFPTGSSITTTAIRSYPTSYAFSGNYYWGDGKLYYQGAYGYWWPSSAYSGDTNISYYLNIGTSLLYPQHTSSKYGGLTVRCSLRLRKRASGISIFVAVSLIGFARQEWVPRANVSDVYFWVSEANVRDIYF